MIKIAKVIDQVSLVLPKKSSAETACRLSESAISVRELILLCLCRVAQVHLEVAEKTLRAEKAKGCSGPEVQCSTLTRLKGSPEGYLDYLDRFSGPYDFNCGANLRGAELLNRNTNCSGGGPPYTKQGPTLPEKSMSAHSVLEDT